MKNQKFLLKTIMTMIQQYGEECKAELIHKAQHQVDIPPPSKPTLVREKPRRKYTKRNPPTDTERVPT